MTREEFVYEMRKAEVYRNMGERPEYWAGYIRGIRRNYHGENFGTSQEHTLWLSLAGGEDESHQDRGQGYRAGLDFKGASK